MRRFVRLGGAVLACATAVCGVVGPAAAKAGPGPASAPGVAVDVNDVSVTWVEPTTWTWDAAIPNASFTEGWRVRSRAWVTPDLDWSGTDGGPQVYVSGTTAAGRRLAAFLSLGQPRLDGACGKDPDGIWTYATAFPRVDWAEPVVGTYTVDQVCVTQQSTSQCRPARPSEAITFVVPDPPMSRAAWFVTRVYRDLFGRAPDAAGLAHWEAALSTGTPNEAVANSLTGSDEYRSRLIAATYERYLGRAADAAGLAFWLTRMRAGVQIEQIQAGFIASDEYFARGGGTPHGWVDLLYRSVLGRVPATAETQWWVAGLGGGMNRGSVALGFLYSTEHLVTVVDGYYVTLLGRHLDDSGRSAWTEAIQRGARDEQVIAEIVASPEYRGRP